MRWYGTWSLGSLLHVRPAFDVQELAGEGIEKLGSAPPLNLSGDAMAAEFRGPRKSGPATLWASLRLALRIT
jgi:hypothetical protein